MTLAEMYAAALGHANALRVLQGGRPLKSLKAGRPMDTGSCPVARTAIVKGKGFKWSVGPVSAGFKDGEEIHRVQTPWHVRQFMLAFDNGEYPELLEREKVTT